MCLPSASPPGNGLVVVGNADSWQGPLDQMPVNRILAPFGLRVLKTTGVESMGQTDIYVRAATNANVSASNACLTAAPWGCRRGQGQPRAASCRSAVHAHP